MKLARCNQCRKQMFMPGAIPRASRPFWSDWNRLCVACSWAESQAAFAALLPPRIDGQLAFGVDDGDPGFFVPTERFDGDRYWEVFDELCGHEHYESLRAETDRRIQEHVADLGAAIAAVPGGNERPKVWSWNV